MESCLRKCSCKNSFVTLLVIKISSLIVDAGIAGVQSQLGFVDVPTDTTHRFAAKRAANANCISRTMVSFGVESVVVRDNLLQPQVALRFDGLAVRYREHGYFFCSIGITIDEWVILDVRHGLHHLSVCIEESALAVCQCLCLCSEEHRGKAILHFPDVHYLVTGNHNGSAVIGLEKLSAFIRTTGEFFGSELFDARL
nr:MAG TPA: hypothetical protein [Caudoviricetes sp.]